MKSGTKLCAAIVVLSLLFVGGTYAAIITYFGKITTTANVEQAVLLDGFDWTQPITEEVTVAGGESFCRPHWLQSQTSVPVAVQFVTTYVPALTDDEITVTYLKPLGYQFTGPSVGDYAVAITVEDGECEVTWTFDFPMDENLGNGNMGYGLVIALDGEGNGPAFQIHNNDGTDSNFPWGTHLYSPWGPTINDGWFGWWSSSINTPVSDLDWVTCTGERYHDTNPTCVFTVTISKCMLGEDFHWAVWFGAGGFYAPQNGYSACPSAFSWDKPIVGDPTGNYELAELAEVLTSPITLQPKELLDFYICYEFAVNIMPQTYFIKSEVQPA